MIDRLKLFWYKIFDPKAYDILKSVNYDKNKDMQRMLSEVFNEFDEEDKLASDGTILK